MRAFVAFGGMLALAGAALAAACSSDAPAAKGADGATGSAGDDGVSCADDPRVDTYTANLDKSGEDGALTFELVASDPAPPAKYDNKFTVVVRDADGGALSGNLGVALSMPSHGHGTSVPPVVSFDAATNRYTIEPVYLFMPGVWRIELDYYGDADPSGSPVDRGFFYFCIEG